MSPKIMDSLKQILKELLNLKTLPEVIDYLTKYSSKIPLPGEGVEIFVLGNEHLIYLVLISEGLTVEEEEEEENLKDFNSIILFLKINQITAKKILTELLPLFEV